MAWRTVVNKLNGKVTINVTGNSANIIVAGNSTVSNLTTNSTSPEVLTGASIRRIQWGTDTIIKVFRGANLVVTLTQSGETFFDQGMGLDAAANIDIQTTSANSWCHLELTKQLSNSSIGLV